MTFSQQLIAATEKRAFQPLSAIRLFHGPGEGTEETKILSVDKYGDHAWVSVEGEKISSKLRQEIQTSCQKLDFKSAAIILRPRKGETRTSECLFGKTPEKFAVENCELKFQIRFNNQRHPGLFLDLDFVRQWLLKFSDQKTVLNLFSYTGSLSCAAGCGGAIKVTSIDLSKTYTEWAKENWKLNNLENDKGEFLYGDSFDWLKRFKKQERLFDIIVCDPPSFSRTKNATFSTSKDTQELHVKIFGVLAPSGVLVTSINTETISRTEFIGFIRDAAKASGRQITIENEFGLPPEFPVRDPRDSYLKGVVLRAK